MAGDGSRWGLDPSNDDGPCGGGVVCLVGVPKRELPLDILEFFCLTQLPGSADRKQLHAAGVRLDPT